MLESNQPHIYSPNGVTDYLDAIQQAEERNDIPLATFDGRTVVIKQVSRFNVFKRAYYWLAGAAARERVHNELIDACWDTEDKQLKQRIITIIQHDRYYFCSKDIKVAVYEAYLTEKCQTDMQQAIQSIKIEIVEGKQPEDILEQTKRLTRAYKSLRESKLDDGFVTDHLVNFIKARLKRQGVSESEIAPETFHKELIDALIDLDNRGLSLDRSKLQYIKRMTNHFDKVVDIEEKLKLYLDSDDCPKWDAETPLYRGGKYHYESKIIRNKQKNKQLYRAGTINVGKSYYGFGLYLTDDLYESETYANHNKQPGMIKIKLKQGTPVINLARGGFRRKMETFGVNDGAFLDYYVYYLCPYHTMLKHEITHKDVPFHYYTLKSPNSIDSAELSDGSGNFNTASTTRLDINGLIKGEPTRFKHVDVPEGTDLVELVGTCVKGDQKKREWPVYVFSGETGHTEYVIQSPEDKKVYWSVKPAPNSPDDYIVEPHPDHVKQRYLSKLMDSYAYSWETSLPSVGLIWKRFYERTR